MATKTKKLTATFFRIHSPQDAYFEQLESILQGIEGRDDTYDTFVKNETTFLYLLHETVEVLPGNTYLLSFAKEKRSKPILFKENGFLGQLEIEDGFVGDLTYAMINPSTRIVALLSLGGGAHPVKHFLNEHSADGKVMLLPLLDEQADEKVYHWDYYDSMKLTFKFTNYDDLQESLTSKQNYLFQSMDELGGLKADINISAIKEEKGNLQPNAIRSTIENFVENHFCTKMAIRGANYSDPATQEVDIKNAVVRFYSDVEVEDEFVTVDLAKQFLTTGIHEIAHFINPK